VAGFVFGKGKRDEGGGDEPRIAFRRSHYRQGAGRLLVARHLHTKRPTSRRSPPPSAVPWTQQHLPANRMRMRLPKILTTRPLPWVTLGLACVRSKATAPSVQRTGSVSDKLDSWPKDTENPAGNTEMAFGTVTGRCSVKGRSPCLTR
jgi:hypothetical protein